MTTFTIAQRIKQAFDPYTNMPVEAWQTFVAAGELVQTKKEEVLKQANGTERYLSFILNGSGGILLWSKNNFVCIDLCYQGNFFGDYMSFLTQQATPLEVVTFEPTELFRISKTNFDALINNSAIGEKICRFAAEGLFIHKQAQQIDIITKTAAERYEELLTKQPEIFKKTPLKYISSYLGITPQSLSRIRSKITG